AALPAPDEPGGQPLGIDAVPPRLLADVGPEAVHVLAQPPRHDERAVGHPGRAAVPHVAGLLDAVGALPRVAEDELAGPQQVLAGLPLVGSGRVLARREDAAARRAADARLRDAVLEAEVLVARPAARPRPPDVAVELAQAGVLDVELELAQLGAQV